MMLLTAAGTLRPLFSEAVSGARMAVLQEFYNHYVLEVLGVPLLAMLAFGPLAAYARAKSAPVGPVAVIGLGAAVSAVGVAVALGIRNGFALAAGAIAAGAIAVIVADLVQSVAARARATAEGIPAAIGRLVRVNRVRYGAQVAHLGVVMVMLGVVGSSLYGVDEIVSLTEGQSAQVGRYTLTLKGLEDMRGVNYAASAAQVKVVYPGGQITALRPERRLYDKSESGMVASEIALASSLREDLYLALAGGDEKTGSVLIKVLVRPLLAWLWVGGFFLTVGGLVPRLLPAWRPAPVEALVGPAARKPANLESVSSWRHR